MHGSSAVGPGFDLGNDKLLSLGPGFDLGNWQLLSLKVVFSTPHNEWEINSQT
jgi:hypothetical protein